MDYLPQTIVCTRHPQCWHNVDSDSALQKGIPNPESPLTSFGKKQRDITAAYLREKWPHFDAVYCSDFSRTHEIPRAAGFVDVIKDTRLNERNMGPWHTLVRKDVLLRYPDIESELEIQGYYAYKAPGGESCPDVETRLRSFLKAEALHRGTNCIYISGHGVAGLCLRRLLTNASVDDWLNWWAGEHLANASVTIFEKQGSSYECVLFNHVPWKGIITDS